MYRAASSYSYSFVLLAFSFAAFVNPPVTSAQAKSGNWAEAESLNAQAINLIAENRFVEAVSVLEKALKTEPKFAEARVNLGSAYLLSGQPETALIHIKRGIEMDPASYKAYNQLGVVYDRLGKTSDSIENLKKSLELNPNYAFGYYNLGSVYLFSNKLKHAVAALERAVKLQPEISDYHVTLGVAYAKQSRFAEAIAEVKGVTVNQPANEHAKLVLCRIYLLANDRTAALDMYQAVKGVNVPLADQMFKSIFSGKILYVEKQ